MRRNIYARSYDRTAGENVNGESGCYQELQWLIWKAGAKLIDIFT